MSFKGPPTKLSKLKDRLKDKLRDRLRNRMKDKLKGSHLRIKDLIKVSLFNMYLI
jgi:hypothetical protein